MTRVSLCVPTYNRGPLLERMLPGLLSAVFNHRNRCQFEVCISDNASSDGTPAVVKLNLARFPDLDIRHERQADNLGFAGNFAAVVRMASGDALIVIADDDELEDNALDKLMAGVEFIGREHPLVLFDSLPGGDAVFRRMRRPTSNTTINNVAELVSRLGIFHASFVSNLMFHRETALARLMPKMLQTRYPHTALALAMLHKWPATFLHQRLVRVTLPVDGGDQPLLTSIDMARVMSDYAFDESVARRVIQRSYLFLLRMLPTAVYQQRRGRCPANPDSPYTDLRLGNVVDCYRRSQMAQAAALLLWSVSRLVPMALLGFLLRRLSRHPR